MGTIRHIAGAAPVYERLRITVPAREALLAAGNNIEPDTLEPDTLDDAGAPHWRLTLAGTVPATLRAVVVPAHDTRGARYGYEERWCLRLDDEPTYPDERPGNDMWTRAALTIACPHRKCGRALVWYEAGHVPGYRICTAGHHSQLDGRCEKATAVR